MIIRSQVNVYYLKREEDSIGKEKSLWKFNKKKKKTWINLDRLIKFSYRFYLRQFLLVIQIKKEITSSVFDTMQSYNRNYKTFRKIFLVDLSILFSVKQVKLERERKKNIDNFSLHSSSYFSRRRRREEYLLELTQEIFGTRWR